MLWCCIEWRTNFGEKVVRVVYRQRAMTVITMREQAQCTALRQAALRRIVPAPVQAALWIQGRSSELFGTDLHPSATIGNGVQVRSLLPALGTLKRIPAETSCVAHCQFGGQASTSIYLIAGFASPSPHSSTMQRALLLALQPSWVMMCIVYMV